MEKNLKKDIYMCVCVYTHTHIWATQVALAVNNPPANAGDTSSICITESLCCTPETS